MNFFSSLFNVKKQESSVVMLPSHEFGFLLEHDEYDCYLFECAKKQIDPLQKIIRQQTKERPGFEMLLCDIFAMCYKAEPQWDKGAEESYYYQDLKNIMSDPNWVELRKKTRFNGLLSAYATVSYAQEYLKHKKEIDKQQNKLQEEVPRGPRFLEKLRKPVTAGIGGSQKQQAFGLAEIERYVDSQNDILSLWGITPPMLPLDGERVMRLAGLLEQHSEFRQFAEKVGQIRESFVRLGKAKLRQKGVRLRGVCIGDDIARAVPSEFALLSDVGSEAIFFERILGRKLTLYDYAQKSERKKGPMVIVIDGSGSVRGEKGYMIRGIAVALVQLARIEKRWASVIIFGSKNEQCEFVFDPYEKAMADRLVEMVTTFYGSGDTIFWEPLELAFERLNTKAFRHGDLVLVTDYIRGTEGPLSSFTERFAQAKEKLGFRYYSLFLSNNKWVSDLSWHDLADIIIPLDTTFFERDSTIVTNQLIGILE